MKFISMALFSVVLSQNVFAQNKLITFEAPVLKGSGCPENTWSSTETPDGEGLSLLFDQMYVQVPQVDGVNDNDDLTDIDDNTDIDSTSKLNPKLAHKVCRIYLKGNVKPRRRLVGIEMNVEFRGAAIVDKGSQAFFRSVLMAWKQGDFEDRQKQILVHRVFNQNSPEDVYIQKTARVITNSRCSTNGLDFGIGLKNILHARIHKNVRPEDTQASFFLDTADIKRKVTIRFKTAPCNNLR